MQAGHISSQFGEFPLLSNRNDSEHSQPPHFKVFFIIVAFYGVFFSFSPC